MYISLSSLQSAFFNQHGCTSSETNVKYNSRAAQRYREKIKTLATQATRQHGTEVTHQIHETFHTRLCMISYVTPYRWIISHFIITYHPSLSFTLFLISSGWTVRLLSPLHLLWTSRKTSSASTHRYWCA